MNEELNKKFGKNSEFQRDLADVVLNTPLCIVHYSETSKIRIQIILSYLK